MFGGNVDSTAGAATAESELAEVLSDFARTMVTDFPIQAILDQLVRRIVEIMPVTGAGVTLIAPDREPRFIAASNGAAMRFEQLQTELAEGPCLAAYHTGEAVSVPNLRTDERFGRFCTEASEAGLAAVFTFPLRHGSSRLGALDLYRDVPGALSPESMSAAQTLADVASAYLLNAQARADLQDTANRSREASLHDPLTGLANRALMIERLEHASQRGRRSHKPMALFFVDLDHFKEVNDTHGHQIGDELLIAIAERMTEAMRPGDTIARISGDEFIILCEDLDAPAQAERILVRLDALFDIPFSLSGSELTVTASIGTAVTTSGDKAPEQLIHHADLAMYQMKRRAIGVRNGFNVTEPNVPADPESLVGTLSGALERGEFRLDYQPIVNTVTGRLTGVEALLRWMHPSRGLIPPMLVIPLAEQSGQIVEIGRWVLSQAWADRRTWEGGREDGIAVSVNVSAHQFMAAGFVDMVAAVLLSGVADPRLLTLEVTEGVFIQDAERAVIVLKTLKDIGVTLALDDFGTGYSSLTQILSYPVDTIKVDRTYIADLAPDTTSETLVTAVVDLAHGLGMTVVSEGVETLDQYNELARLGADECQGFYFARPMPAHSINTLLNSGSAHDGTRLPITA
jgi:diguanylate cyclase (GGDEF)-like protein